MNFSQAAFANGCWPSYNLVQLFERAYTTGKITALDRTILLGTLFNPSTDNEDLTLIDRLYWAIRKGRVAVAVDANFPSLDKAQFPKPLISKYAEHHYSNLKL